MSYLYQQGRAPHSSDNLNPATFKRKLWGNWPLFTHHPCTLCCSFSFPYGKKKPNANYILPDIRLILWAVESVSGFKCSIAQNWIWVWVKAAMRNTTQCSQISRLHTYTYSNTRNARSKKFTPFLWGLIKGMLANVGNRYQDLEARLGLCGCTRKVNYT